MTTDETGRRAHAGTGERGGPRASSLLKARSALRSTPSGRRTGETWLNLKVLVSAVAVLVALALGWPLVLGAVIVAFVHTRLGPRAVFQSLAAVVIIKFLNSAIYSFPPMFGLLAWALLLVAALRVIGLLNRNALPVLVPVWFFIAVVAVLTPFASASPTVTWFKLASFLVGTTTVIITAYALSAEDVRFLRSWLPSVALAVAVVSVPTFAFPGISYRIAPNLFQGVMNHSQALGAFLAPLVTLLGARWLFHRASFTKVDGAFLLLTAIIMIATNARTATVAVLLGIGGSMLLGLIRGRRSRQESVRGLVLGTVIAVLGLSATLANQQVREGVLGFVFKNSDESSVEDAFMASRGAGLTDQWQNFLKHPLTGTGFGVNPTGTFIEAPVTVLGIPISAPVEKGFLPTAVLEEVGVPGALAFLVLVAVLIRQAYRSGDSVWLAVLLTCLFVNLGEAVFFSMGGLGLLFWLWIGLAMRSVSPAAGNRSRSEATRGRSGLGRVRPGDNILR